MAAMAASKPPSPNDGSSASSSRTEDLPMPSRNPLPLSASQEAQVREVFNARVRGMCADEIKGDYLGFSCGFRVGPFSIV